jgi:predicted MFS family arabinose efflux permease
LTAVSDADASAERRLLLVLAAVQFVNVLDFVMVMPLGPDFALALGIPTHWLGVIAGSYTAAAALAGLAGMLFLDRFDRKRALCVALAGLCLATLIGGLSIGLGTLVAARFTAGMFGGPATSLTMALIADSIPPARRGRALGLVLGAFSVASVVGIPAGLELARLGGWRMPFFAVGALGLAVLLMAMLTLPPQRAHLTAAAARSGPPPGTSFGRPAPLLAFASASLTMLSVFAIVPNLSAFIQFNVGYPRSRLGLLYLVGGVLSFATMRIAGALVDKIGAARVAVLGTALFVTALSTGFAVEPPLLPILAIFCTLMVSGSFRMVPMTSLSTRVPHPHERARFMSVGSTVQHVASAVGSASSSLFLRELPGGRLVGMDRVALFSIGVALVMPVLLFALEARVRAQEAGVPPG